MTLLQQAANAAIKAWESGPLKGKEVLELRKAMDAEQAAEDKESAGYWLERAKELVEIFEDAPSFSEVATKISVKQTPSAATDELALTASGEIMSVMYGAMPPGGSVQLRAMVQCIVQRANDAQQVAVLAGYALVPIEPTAAMIVAGRCTPCTADEMDMDEDYRAVYQAMLAAAPQPPQGDKA